MPPSCRPPPTGTGIGSAPAAGDRWRTAPTAEKPSIQAMAPHSGRNDAQIRRYPLGDIHYRNSAPVPSPELQRLGALVGRWRSQGHIVGDSPVPITGTGSYQWLPGGFFLVHHVDVMVGDQPVQALELIGEYDPATDSFTARAYNLGNITIMQTRVDEQECGGSPASATSPRWPGPPPPTPATRCGPR
jgi:Protein of unknown function (DUF1579)